jgi:membrane-associated phospholipid phosphatase
MRDDIFDALDRALGFDWMGLLHWMNAHPVAHAILNAAYMSFQPQATITVLTLAFTGRVIRLRVFLLAFLMTALITIAMSAALPAEGVWSHYGLRADAASILPVSYTSWPVFHGLRDGTMQTLMAAGSEGIITFPSLHAALGLIFVLAVWPVPLLRWVSLTVNALMIAGTPIDGSHYLVDVIAGLAIAALCWLAAERFARRAPAP